MAFEQDCQTFRELIANQLRNYDLQADIMEELDRIVTAVYPVNREEFRRVAAQLDAEENKSAEMFAEIVTSQPPCQTAGRTPLCQTCTESRRTIDNFEASNSVDGRPRRRDVA